MTINRQLPGPALHVCRNDLVVIDVTNHMDGAGTTLHWHGMRQRGTPFSDGVPFVTQCHFLGLMFMTSITKFIIRPDSLWKHFSLFVRCGRLRNSFLSLTLGTAEGEWTFRRSHRTNFD